MTKRSSEKKGSGKLYAILSGKKHRVVARATKKSTAIAKAKSLLRRGSKRVSIRYAGRVTTVTLGKTVKRTSKRASKRASKRHSKGRTSKRRSRRRASKRTSKRRSRR